jgi:glucose-6-phosphate 1-epimerase
MPDIDALNTRFGVTDRVTFARGPGALATVDITNVSAQARIALQGAQVLHWAPAGAAPVIWLSPTAKFAEGRAIRGGIPICWPWFGPHPSETTYPAHGFARISHWEVVAVESISDGETRLLFRLIPSDAARAWWPHATPAELHVNIGKRLSLELVTKNLGVAPVVISQALHTYFAVSDVRSVHVLGLDGSPYIDKVDGGKTKLQKGPVTFSAETDRIYLNSIGENILVDRGLKRRLRVAKTGSSSTVIWNPWIQKSAKMDDFVESGYVNMVCIEAANAADDAVTVAPGEEHRLGVVYAVEGLT